MKSNVLLSKMKTLRRSEVDGVEKLVLFIGNVRSGTSIIGSMLDAHPNMITSYQFDLFNKWIENPHMSKVQLFNDLYRSSQSIGKGPLRD